jgi:hypothetical protein
MEEGKAKKLRDTQLMIMREIHNTNVRLEISTVVTKENIDQINYLGGKLCAINNNIIWRVEEYYRNGKQTNRTDKKFDLDAARYDSLMTKLSAKFSNSIVLRQSSQESRAHAPDPFLFPDGTLHTTSDHFYKLIDRVEEYNFKNMQTRRDWKTYMNSLRNWQWERDDYHDQVFDDIYTREMI